jgi:hypothetical protein
MPNTNNWTN